MDGRDETQREREPHPMLEVHDSRRGHIPGSEEARSKTRGIISHAGGARSMRGGEAGSHPRLETGCTIQSGAPHRGETPAQGAWPKQTPPPTENGAWPGLPAAGVSREGGVASAEGAWRRTPLGGRGPLPLPAGGGARGGRCVWGGRGVRPTPCPPTRPPPPAPARAALPWGKAAVPSALRARVHLPEAMAAAWRCAAGRERAAGASNEVSRDRAQRRPRAQRGTRSSRRLRGPAANQRARSVPLARRRGGGRGVGQGRYQRAGWTGGAALGSVGGGGEQGALGRHHFVAAGDDRGILGAAGSQPKGQDCRCVSGNRVS